MSVGALLYNPAIAANVLIGSIAIASPRISDERSERLSHLEQAASRLEEIGTGREPDALKALEDARSNPFVRNVLDRHALVAATNVVLLNNEQLDSIDRVAASLITGANLMTTGIVRISPLTVLKTTARLLEKANLSEEDFLRNCHQLLSFDGVSKQLVIFDQITRSERPGALMEMLALLPFLPEPTLHNPAEIKTVPDKLAELTILGGPKDKKPN